MLSEAFGSGSGRKHYTIRIVQPLGKVIRYIRGVDRHTDSLHPLSDPGTLSNLLRAFCDLRLR